MENPRNNINIIMTYSSSNTLVFVIYIFIYIYMNNTMYTLPFLTYGGVCDNGIDDNSLMNQR